MSEKVKNLIAIVLSVLVGAAAWFVAGGSNALPGVNDVSGLLAVVGAIYGFSQVIYHYLLDGTKVDNALESFASPDNNGGDAPGA